MLSVLFSWAWMLLTTGVVGFSLLRVLPGGQQNHAAHTVLLAGLAAVTVYAQLFSLLAGVGAAATGLLGLGCLGLGFWQRKALGRWLALQKKILAHTEPLRLLLCALLAVLLCAMTAGLPDHESFGDTLLYHAQAIRWIEEYGVVPGLGNLHNRLAYNSSFFSLQALYSLRFLWGQSLHSVNGFVCLLFSGYAVLTLRAGTRKTALSDGLRAAILLFLGLNFRLVPTDSSDLLAMLLVLYLLAQWLNWEEVSTPDILPYCGLCLLGVFAVSVKLSTLPVLLLVLKPACRLLKEKRWGLIAGCIGGGLLLILPYLIRNVVLSGWLVYPYTAIDLFRFDWKMPASVVDFDRAEITAWGRGVKDVELPVNGLGDWLPGWLAALELPYKLLLLPACAALVWLAVKLVRSLVRRTADGFSLVYATVWVCFGFWLLSAPLTRYGGAYLLAPAGLLWAALVARWDRHWRPVRLVTEVLPALFLAAMLGLGVWQGAANLPLLAQLDYPAAACEGYTLPDGTVIQIPLSGSQAGYWPFPSSPFAGRMATIRLRTDGDLSDGFYTRPEYLDVGLTTYGSTGWTPQAAS